jgi:hypothetical protein
MAVIKLHHHRMALVNEHQLFEHPTVGLWRVVIEGDLVVATGNVAHRADTATFDPRTAIPKLQWEPVGPHVRWLDDMVVDADDQRNLRRYLCSPIDVDHRRAR